MASSREIDSKKVIVEGHNFELTYSNAELLNRITELASEIDAEAAKDPETDLVLIGVMVGCFRFLADLSVKLNTSCCITTVRIKSYHGLRQGQLKSSVDLGEDIAGKNVIIVEDVVDSGKTIYHLIRLLNKMKPKTIKVATLFLKPDSLIPEKTTDGSEPMDPSDLPLKYVGFRIPNKFIVGYGLDVHGFGRNLNGVYQLVDK